MIFISIRRLFIKKSVKRIIALALLITTFANCSLPVFASGRDDYNKPETVRVSNTLNSVEDVPSKFEGIDLFESNFHVDNMNQQEKEFYYFLLEREANKYIKSTGFAESEEQVKQDIETIINNDSTNVLNLNLMMERAPWCHLNTVSKVDSAINIVISAAFAALGEGLSSGGIRALIAKVGEAEAKKIVKNTIVNKVKNTLIAWAMSNIAGKAAGGLFTAIMWATDPGTKIAEMLDAHDAKPNDGYIEGW